MSTSCAIKTAVIVMLAAAGCTRGPDPEALKRQYDIMDRNGANPRELCSKAREVADAWLIREDQVNYQLWDSTSKIACNQALLDSLHP